MASIVKSRVPNIMRERDVKPIDLVRKAEIGYGTAFRLFNGEGESISYPIMAKLCDFLGVTPGDLFEYTPDKGKKSKG